MDGSFDGVTIVRRGGLPAHQRRHKEQSGCGARQRMRSSLLLEAKAVDKGVHMGTHMGQRVTSGGDG
jgi:hypothetical protein